MTQYPRRLIEVDLPIKRISAHARREKSIRHGHISTLHIWWARRPLAACRAVICAALWPDPADPLCPQAFREKAADLITAFALKATSHGKLADSCSQESMARWLTLAKPGNRLDPTNPAHLNVLRFALLDFIADFANWDNSTVKEYLETARLLTQIAHLTLSDFGFAIADQGRILDLRLPICDRQESSNQSEIENLKSKIANLKSALENLPRPLVVDPFAGGGSIPLEALRVGADAFASDLNPVAVLLNKVVLEYIPKYGQRLADEVRKWGEWIKKEAEKELAEFYPKDPDGATPIAYLWTRTIICEGPGCGAEVPLIRSLWLSKKSARSTALRMVPNPKAKRIDFEIVQNVKAKDVAEGTVRRGSATCPICGVTTPVAAVRRQLKERRGGAADARLFCVVTTRPEEQGRFYRLPTNNDLEAVRNAAAELERRKKTHEGPLSLVPDEALDIRGIRHTWAMIYGLERWGDYFTPRQALALATLTRLVSKIETLQKDLSVVETTWRGVSTENTDGLMTAVQICLALAVDRQADYGSSLCRWVSGGEFIGNTFGRQAIPMMWDFCEVNPGSESTGGFSGACSWIVNALDRESESNYGAGLVERASATIHPLPNDAAHAFVTDPPYYDAVPYAYLSDFFYVWLRRSIAQVQPELLKSTQVPKNEEIVVDRPHELSNSTKDITFYEQELTKAFADGCRVLRPDGVGTIVFASKTTASWEAILQAVVDAGWTITASWPIDTEMEARVAAQGQARLASSVHLVCRPRENPDGSLRIGDIGDWRDVLAELPRRIHEWMPRLAAEGVVGADAIFACLGPALEIFSRYSRVEKASGEQVSLKEYLEYVWAAVAKEALDMIFAGADVTGFEEDARLTAMWLWTLNSDLRSSNADFRLAEEENDDEDRSPIANPKSAIQGFALEYDAARKIAQGLGAHLEHLTSLVEVKGETARLLPVSERTRALFGKEDAQAPAAKRKKANPQMQLGFMQALERAEEEDGWGAKGAPRLGATILDRIHQAMILFAAGRAEAMKRFLVEEGGGNDPRFWRLAQALSALYPSYTDEKRWVDGVLARKKGLGF